MAILKFKPAWWLKNPHIQTMWPTLVGRHVALSTHNQRLELPDGDFIDLTWDKANRLDDDKPIVLILHGLGGNLNSPYAKGFMSAISERGWRPVFMHFRGASSEPNRLDRGYHSGETEDLAFVVNHLQQQHDTVAVVGVSLGGNVLLKWLGESGKSCPIQAAVAVSVPFELDLAVAHMNQGVSQLYQYWLLRSLRGYLARKYQNREAPFNLDAANTARTFLEFDEIVTAPLHGFRDASDYYQKSSSRPYLGKIAVPLMIIHAKDDPFMPHHVIPTPQELSASTTLNVTEQGGHVGFISANEEGKAEYWLDTQIPHFLSFHL